MANKNITLSASIRNNLLTLQNTSSLIGRTETRLASGLKVSSAIDNAVAYFQAKALSDRGADMAEKKDGIDQGISQLETVLQAITSIEEIVSQMKGLLISAKSSTAEERKDLQAQFTTLAENIDHLANDANYQGTNLVNSTATKLKIDFSNLSSSYLEITGKSLLISKAFTVNVKASQLANKLVTVAAKWSAISNKVSGIELAIKQVDKTLNALRGHAKALGSNVSLLQTRLDFTKSYVNTLDGGAGKLTLADMNEEGANLVALQTRQQLGIQALQFSGQAEQSVLRLFS